MLLLTRIGGYELDEQLSMNENLSFFDMDRKSQIFMRGGGGKLHVTGPMYNEMQQFSVSYPCPDGDVGASQAGPVHCYHFMGSGKWSDFVEELRYIKKTDVLVVRYHNNQSEEWFKDVEFEGVFFAHWSLRAFIQLRHIRNTATELREIKLIHYVDLNLGGDEENDQGTWDAARGAFLCWDAVNPKACYMLVGSTETPTHRGINIGMWSQCWGGQVADNDSYGPGSCGIGFQYNLALSPGEEVVLPFYIVIGDTQSDVESEWDSLTANGYETVLSDTVSAWRNWVDNGIIVSFEDHPWMTEAWIRNLISVYEMTWANGGISASTGVYRACFPWDSTFAIRTLLDAGHIDEVRSYLSFLRTAVANDGFDPYPASAYNYNGEGEASQGGPDLVHGCYMPVLLVWELYQKTGELTDLTDNWDMVKKYLDYARDNFYNRSGYNLIKGLGFLDHPYRYHSDWAETKYYASFQIGYYQGFTIGTQIADLTGHLDEKTSYEQIAAELKTAVDDRFLVNSVYRSVWDFESCPTAEGWDIELSCMYGRTGFNSETQRRTFREWEKWLTDYLPHHYDEFTDRWIYGYAFADLLHSLILYGYYDKFMMLYNRFRHVANNPKIQTAERVYTYEKSVGQTIFCWSHAITGALARLFDWAKDENGNYVFNLSPAPEVGRYTATFPDGTSVTVKAEGHGSRAEISMSPVTKDHVWNGENKKLNLVLSPGEELVLDVAMGGYFGLAERAAFAKKAELHGETVQVKKRILVGEDQYGNPIYDYAARNVEKAIINPVKGDEKIVAAGLLTVGDAVGWFKPGSTVAKNCRVETLGSVFEVVSVEQVRVQGVTTCLKVGLKRET